MTAAAGTLAMGVMGAGALGQAGEGVPARGAPTAAVQPAPSQPEAARLNVDFPGGPVMAYVEMLRRQAPAGMANIVVSAAAARVPLAPIMLRDVTVATAVFAMRTAAGSAEGELHVNPFGVRHGEPIPARDTLYQVDYYPRPEMQTARTARQESPTQMHVLSLRPVLNAGAGTVEVRAEPVLTAVQAAIELAPGSEPAEVRFHAETALLMVRGSAAQLRAAEACVEEIANDLRARREAEEAALKPEMMLADLRAEMAEAEAGVRIAHERLERRTEEFKAARALYDAGTISMQEFGPVQEAMEDARREVEKSMVRRQRAAERLAITERRYGGGEMVALVVECAGWAPGVYAEVAGLAESVYKGAPAPKVTRGEGQTLHVQGPRGRVQVLVQVVQEAAHARGVGAPHVRPAVDGR
jgi:hypothetical protein